MAVKSTSATRKSNKSRKSWSLYVKRTLTDVNKDVSLSKKSMDVVNSFVNDIFERIATQAASLTRANKGKTLGSAEMQTAVRLVLPAELAKHAMAEATKASKAARTSSN